jgi:serine/threonine-protein kinase RsbW
VSQTRTGDQLDSHQVRVNIPAGGADCRNFNHLAAGPEAVSGPVGAGGDLLAHPPHPRRACQSADDGIRQDTEPAPEGALEAAEGAAVPALAAERRYAGLTDPDVGNVFAMVRFDPLPSHGLTAQRLGASQLDVTVPATAHNATVLRGAFRRWVDCLIDDDAADDLTLAVYEALANAAEHAFTTHAVPGLIWLRALTTNGQIIITVADNGSWRCPTDSYGYRGRGLPLIHQLTTEARIAPSPYGTTVWLRRQLRNWQESTPG